MTANNFDSSSCPVTSGVQQGSVPCPLLFLVYVNDLTNVVHSPIRLHDPTAIQSDLNAITNWCSAWQMHLNIKKCKVMRISQKPSTCNPPLYHIDGSVPEEVTTYKYLGAHLTANLFW